jgi:hypothetical protein
VAPRKKRFQQRGAQSPNAVLVIFLIFFVLATVITGVLAYYGYTGQDKLKKDAKEAEAKVKAGQKAEEWKEFQSMLARKAMGSDLYKDDTTDEENTWQAYVELFDTKKGTLKEDATKFKDEKNRAKIEEMFKFGLETLGWDGKKFKSSYRQKLAKVQGDLKKAQADYATVLDQKEKLKDDLEKLGEQRKKFFEQALEAINKGNKKALDAALEKTKQIEEVVNKITELNEKIKEVKERSELDLRAKDKEIFSRDSQINTLRKEVKEMAEALASADPKGAKNIPGQPNSLVIDMSMGRLLWDKPQAKVVRIDPSGRKIYLDKGRAQGVRPGLTFAVFAAGPKDRAQGRIKGTVEVQEVLDANASVAWITSIFDDEGDEVPLMDARRGTLLRQGANPIREGDLLFNPAWGAHVAIAGVLDPGGVSSSPAEQMRQLHKFMALLHKVGITVDAYLDVSDGTVKGAITEHTNFLIKGALARAEDENPAAKAAKGDREAAKAMAAEAVARGAFIISLDNFVTLIGYRPPPGSAELPVSFRPGLPTAGTGLIGKTLGGEK